MALKSKYPLKSDGGIKANWSASRPDMLRARLITKTLRMLAPDVVAGIYTPEELDDDRLEIPSAPLPGARPLFDPSREIKPVSETIPEAPRDPDPVSAPAEVTAPAVVEPVAESVPASDPVSAPAESAPEFIGAEGEVFKSQTLADLSHFEEAANSYLSEFLKWIKPGWTFRELGDIHVGRIGFGNEAFRKKAEDHFEKSQNGKVQ